MDPKASIDRLTIVGGVAGSECRLGRIAHGDFLDVHDLCESYSEGDIGAKYPYQYAYQLQGGGHVSVAREGTKVPVLRVDLNPNKLDPDAPVRSIVDRMLDTRITRCDVAIDYFGRDVGDFIPVGRSGKRFSVSARSGAIQTQMIGARSAARQLVVYDKIADCRAKREPLPWDFDGSVMRVEARERIRPADGSTVLAPDLVDDVQLLTRGGGDVAIKDRALIDYLARNPDEWGDLSPYMRRRLRNLGSVRGSSTLQPSPAEVYRGSRSLLLDQYFSVVGG